MSPPAEVPFAGPEAHGSMDFALRGEVLDVAVHAEPADAGERREPSGASLHVPITTRQQALAIAAAFTAWASLLPDGGAT